MGNASSTQRAFAGCSVRITEPATRQRLPGAAHLRPRDGEGDGERFHTTITIFEPENLALRAFLGKEGPRTHRLRAQDESVDS